jgi:peptidoglycan glycosyltransferase
LDIKNHYSSAWKGYQENLKREERRKALMKKFPVATLYSGICLLILFFVFYTGSRLLGHLKGDGYSPVRTQKAPVVIPEKIPDQDLSFELKDLDLDVASLSDHFFVQRGETGFMVQSSLDADLQDYILSLLKRSRTEQAAVVVLSPTDGRILAMANYEKEGKGDNLCTKAVYPAASLFKIVSAAAAIETAGFTPDRAVIFTGRKHTLYKRQLKKKAGRYSTKTSFREAFGSSINSVFGKMGIYNLGRNVISEYAGRFLFNRLISFDFPVEKSTLNVPDDDYGLAEIASGFNRVTLISPLHAALLASAVANKGIMMTPRLIERVSGGSGELLYQSRPGLLASPISRGTAKDLKVLMQDTILNGTCRKSFRALRRNKAFRNVELGAKTGTINDKLDRFKYDWLTLYALPRDGTKCICMAVLSVHGEKLGIRASELGMHIIKYYITM